MASPNKVPDLSVVDVDGSAESESKTPPIGGGSQAPSSTPAASQPSSPGRKFPLWAVAVLVAVGAVLVISQYQRAEGLQAQVGLLEVELAAVGAKLDAYQSHLDGVRAGIDDMSQRMGALQDLAHRDPMAPVMPGSAASSDSPATGSSSEGTQPEAATSPLSRPKPDNSLLDLMLEDADPGTAADLGSRGSAF